MCRIIFSSVIIAACAHAASADPGQTVGLEFGQEAPPLQECALRIDLQHLCNARNQIIEPDTNSPIRISGRAKMGVAYDGDQVNPVSGFSITFDFGSETDSGLNLGAVTTVESE